MGRVIGPSEGAQSDASSGSASRLHTINLQAGVAPAKDDQHDTAGRAFQLFDLRRSQIQSRVLLGDVLVAGTIPHCLDVRASNEQGSAILQVRDE